MNRKGFTTRAGVACLLLLTLTACSGGSGIDGSGGATEEPVPPAGESGGGTVAECVQGHTWTADVPDMGQQLLEQLQSSGSPATSATGTGSQTLEWGTDGRVLLSTDYIFTVVAPLDDGLVMTMKQSHSGPASGTLLLDGNVASPTEDWDASGYIVTTAVDINGVTSPDSTFPVGDAGLSSGVGLTVTCEGNVMTTFAQGGFVTQKWDNFGD